MIFPHLIVKHIRSSWLVELLLQPEIFIESMSNNTASLDSASVKWIPTRKTPLNQKFPSVGFHRKFILKLFIIQIWEEFNKTMNHYH